MRAKNKNSIVLKSTIRMGIFGLLLVIGLLLAIHPGAVVSGQAQQDLTGTLTLIWGDDEAGTESTLLYFLHTSDATYQLQLADDFNGAGTLFSLNGQEVVVSGEIFSTPETATEGETILVINAVTAATVNELDQPSASYSGSYPYISLLCKFPDKTGVERELSYFTDQYSSAWPGLDHYWREASYGKFNVSGSAALGWRTLPQNWSYYMDYDSENVAHLNHTRIARDCTGLYDADVNFSQFFGVNLMFNSDLDGFAWGGGMVVNRDGVYAMPGTWEPPWGWGNNTVMAHEMGHSFGLPHSTWQLKTYWNRFDIMSDGWTDCNRSRHPLYSDNCLPQHTIGYHKTLLGVLDDNRKTKVLDGGGGTFTLERLNLPTTSDLQYVEAPINNDPLLFYTIEARQNDSSAGYDVKLPQTGVVIHLVNKNNTSQYYEPADLVGVLTTDGDTFVDAANNIHINLLQTTSTGFVVSIANDIAPVTQAPTPITPLGGTVTSDGRPTFSWTEVPNATQYTFEIKRRPDHFIITKRILNAADICSAGVCTIEAPKLLPPADYKWHANGRNEVNVGPFSEYQYIYISLPATTLITPKNYGSVFSDTPMFQWQALEGADSYRLEIKNLNNDVIADISGITVDHCDENLCSYELTSGLAQGQYKWHVQGIKGETGGDWSTYFNLKKSIMSVPTPILPTEMTQYFSTTPTLKWEPVDDVSHYEVMVYDILNDTFEKERFNAGSVCKDDVCQLRMWYELSPGGKYRWRVRAVADIIGDWSPYNSFRIGVIDVPLLRSPADDAIIYGGRPTLKWLPITEAKQFNIEVNRSDGSLLGTWSMDTTDCDADRCWFRIPGDLADNYDSYTWRVQAQAGTGKSEWSKRFKFIYTQLDRTVQISPVDKATLTDKTPRLKWTDVVGATMYLVEFRQPNGDLVSSALVADATYCDGSECTWDANPALAVGEYTWHVRAKNGLNFGRWTAYRTLTIK